VIKQSDKKTNKTANFSWQTNKINWQSGQYQFTNLLIESHYYAEHTPTSVTTTATEVLLRL